MSPCGGLSSKQPVEYFNLETAFGSKDVLCLEQALSLFESSLRKSLMSVSSMAKAKNCLTKSDTRCDSIVVKNGLLTWRGQRTYRTLAGIWGKKDGDYCQQETELVAKEVERLLSSDGA